MTLPIPFSFSFDQCPVDSGVTETPQWMMLGEPADSSLPAPQLGLSPAPHPSLMPPGMDARGNHRVLP